jgi:hypothetical protein
MGPIVAEPFPPLSLANFLEQSHKKLEAVVPKIHEHYRQGT